MRATTSTPTARMEIRNTPSAMTRVIVKSAPSTIAATSAVSGPGLAK
jgi:hypothetical protein